RSCSRNSSSEGLMGSWCARSDRIALDERLELLTELAEIARGHLELARARDVLRAGLLDVLHGARHLVHAHELLLARGRDLRRGLRGLGDAARERLDGFARDLRLPAAGFHGLVALLGREHGGRGGLLDVGEDRAHAIRRVPRLLREALHLLCDDAEAL